MDERAARAWLASRAIPLPSERASDFPSETADQVAQALEDAGIDLVADLD